MIYEVSQRPPAEAGGLREGRNHLPTLNISVD